VAVGAKLKKLEAYLKGLPGLTIALSGGIDSSVLLILAQKILGPGRLQAISVSSIIMPERDLIRAQLLTAKLKVEHLILPFDHLSLENFRQNPPNRCYHCKRAMFAEIQKFSRFPLADGTQAEDLEEDRPGLEALKELGILSPLKEIGFKKEDLRVIAKRERLDYYKQEPSPCLATRFLPGEEITPQKIALLKVAEDYLEAQGWRKIRVRLIQKVALIELGPEEIEKAFTFREEIVKFFRSLGFRKIYFSLEGYMPPRLSFHNHP